MTPSAPVPLSLLRHQRAPVTCPVFIFPLVAAGEWPTSAASPGARGGRRRGLPGSARVPSRLRGETGRERAEPPAGRGPGAAGPSFGRGAGSGREPLSSLAVWVLIAVMIPSAEVQPAAPSRVSLNSLLVTPRLTMSLPAKRCGRPPVLSFLEKKKRKQSLDRRRGKTRIYVGSHIDRWLTLKEKLDFRNDAEVAGFLLDL